MKSSTLYTTFIFILAVLSPLCCQGGRVLDFYEGKSQTPSGDSLSKIYTFSNQQLERKHDYIQYLFPTKNPSRSQPMISITLSDRDGRQFKRSERLQNKVRRSLGLMARFYGLRYDAQNAHFSCSAQFSQRAQQWITPNNHNFKRLTRILTSLHQLGLHKESRNLFNCLERIYQQEPYKHPIGTSTYNHWKKAAY